MKLAVASCIKIQETNPQPAWAEILAERPDTLLLLGDTVYLEHNHHDDPDELTAELKQRYAAQFAEPAFAALLNDLRARGCPVLSIYDDHDFLGNNRYGGDHSPALREAARKEFIRVFEPTMTGTDVYHLARVGPADIVVLDERFYRQSPAASANDRNAVLGAEQWAWFEQVVADSTATYLVVASSTTLHSFGDESWEQYPAAFQRIVTLLHKHPHALVVSGDVHRNATYDDSGVIEVVTSAVARNGLLFGSPRKNYGILTFDDKGLRVELRSRKVGWRFDFRVPLGQWFLP